MSGPVLPPLLHYSASPFAGPLRSEAQQQGDDCPSWKPDGFWVSAGDGEDSWPAYYRRTWPEGTGLDYVQRVTLHPAARILHLRSAADLDRFTEAFGLTAPAWGGGLRGLGMSMGGIDWPQVAAEYQGIVIAPYVYAKRMALFWYYGWDCASGCIWDADAIASIEPVTSPAMEAPHDS